MRRASGRDDAGRRGRAQPVGAALLAQEARGDDLEPAGAGEPEPERLVEPDAAHAGGVDARLAVRQQAAARVQGAETVAGQAEAPEGQDVGADREQRHDAEQEQHVGPPRQPRHHRGAVAEDRPLLREAREALRREADDRGGARESGDRERGVADPGGVEPQEQLVVGGGWRVAGHLVDRHRCAGRRGQAGHGGVEAVEQLGPQPAPGVDAQRVEDEPVVAAAGGRDLDLGQAEQPVVDPGREVDGAHLVESRGRRLLGEQAPPQLDLAVGDAVAGGQPTQDAEGDDERDGIQLPPVVAVGAGPEDDDREQRGKETDQRLERVDEQHPGVEPAPAVGVLGVLVHVASPVSATAAAVRASTSSWATGQVEPVDGDGSGGRRGRDGHGGEPEQLGDGAALEVDRLHPAERGDAALLPEPARSGCRSPAASPPNGARGSATAAWRRHRPPRRRARPRRRPSARVREAASSTSHHTTCPASSTASTTTAWIVHMRTARRETRWAGLAEHGLPVNGHVGWFHGPTVPHDPDGRSEAYGGCRERARHGRRTPGFGQEHHGPPRTAAGRLSMPLHSVEAVLDADTDTQVRREWDGARRRGSAEPGGHQGTTNAPHLTLSAAASVPDCRRGADRSHALAGMRPVPVRLGALLVMGSRRFVLARLVVPTAELLALHAGRRWARWSAAPDVPERVRAGPLDAARDPRARTRPWSRSVTALAVLGRCRPSTAPSSRCGAGTRTPGARGWSAAYLRWAHEPRTRPRHLRRHRQRCRTARRCTRPR